MSKKHFFVIVILALLSNLTEVQAQILWEHKTSNVFLNPVTQAVDSELCFSSISCYGNTCIAGGLASNLVIPPYLRSTFYKSIDAGKSWFEVAPPVHEGLVIPDGITKVQMIDELHAVAISNYGTVHYTNDGAKTWQRRDLPVWRDELFDVHFSDSLTGIVTCVGKGSLDSMKFITTNAGQTWKNVYMPFGGESVQSLGGGKFKVCTYGRGVIYTFNDNGELLDSTKEIFNSENDPKYTYIIGWFRFGRGDTLFGYGWFNPKETPTPKRQGLIIRSTDGGKSWGIPYICPPLTIDIIKCISSVDRDTIIAGGLYRPYYAISFDRGSTWKIDSIQIDTSYDADLFFAVELLPDGTPLAAIGPNTAGAPRSTVIARGKYLTTGIEVVETIQYHTRLYPNPSSGIVNITSIDKSGAGITVVDILGREVYRGKLSNDGTASLDLRNVPKGIYYIVFNHYGKEFIAGKIALTIE